MAWVSGAVILIIAGLVLRHILRLDSARQPSLESSSLLSPDGQGIYLRVALELETQASMLAISLNDAFQEKGAGRNETAWRLVRLAASEWDRLANTLEMLLSVLTKNLASADRVIPHGIVARRYKSQLMIDYARLYELLDRLAFHSKLRFQLQIRLVRRATQNLTSEFRHTFRYLEQTQDDSPEVWKRLDLYFHDFDMISKKALLTLRGFLVGLRPQALADLLPALQSVVEGGVRSTSVRTTQRR